MHVEVEKYRECCVVVNSVFEHKLLLAVINRLPLMAENKFLFFFFLPVSKGTDA
jgi:hypothetical protein